MTLILTYKNQLSLEELFAYAHGTESVPELDDAPVFREQIMANHHFLLEKVASAWPIYGTTTGFGASSASRMEAFEVPQLQKNLYRYHGCGVGPAFSPGEAAAILLVRLNCLTQGCSGVSFELLERLTFFLRQRILPVIPCRGSVGASGDLTPLSYIAAALAGEREVYWRGQKRAADEVHRELQIEPYVFKAREALAIMNGTSVMSALAGLAWLRVQKLVSCIEVSTAMMVELWQGPASPFLPQLHAVKPHPGQQKVAAKIAALLYEAPQRLLKRSSSSMEGAVQDPYSIRCTPQLLGSLQDVLDMTRSWIEREINSVNDNPVFLHEEDQVLNGGHFFGGHIAAAADALKSATASAINLLDRQMALLMESRGRLPENLVSQRLSNSAARLHHGFKAMQITMSAIAAEAAKSAMPMAVFSRPTEASNQDVVSMGTIAARDLLSISDMAMDAAAIQSLALRQSFYLLEEEGRLPPLAPALAEILGSWTSIFPMQREDRALDTTISAMKTVLFGGLAWS